MKILFTLFLIIAVAAIGAGFNGAGLLSLVSAVCVVFAYKKLDALAKATPAVTTPCSTESKLDEHCCECTGGKTCT
jgi:hypothetical protein